MLSDLVVLTVMKKIIILISFFSIKDLYAQELFVFTEPASNMAVSNAGIRLNNSFLKEAGSAKTDYNLAPELMFGISKKLMMHAEVFSATGILKAFLGKEHRFMGNTGSTVSIPCTGISGWLLLAGIVSAIVLFARKPLISMGITVVIRPAW